MFLKTFQKNNNLQVSKFPKKKCNFEFDFLLQNSTYNKNFVFIFIFLTKDLTHTIKENNPIMQHNNDWLSVNNEIRDSRTHSLPSKVTEKYFQPGRVLERWCGAFMRPKFLLILFGWETIGTALFAHISKINQSIHIMINVFYFENVAITRLQQIRGLLLIFSTSDMP